MTVLRNKCIIITIIFTIVIYFHLLSIMSPPPRFHLDDEKVVTLIMVSFASAVCVKGEHYICIAPGTPS